MLWIAPSEKDNASAALEKRLWGAAEQALPASHLAKTEYNSARPEGLLGLIFLRFAEVRFAAQRAKLEKASTKGGNGHSPRRGSRLDEPAAYHAEGILYLPAEARFDHLPNRPEAEHIGMARCEVRVASIEVQPVRQSKFAFHNSLVPASPDENPLR